MEKIIKIYPLKKIILVLLLIIANIAFASFCYFASVLSVQQTVVKDVSRLIYNNTTDSPKAVLSAVPFYHTFTFNFSSDFYPKDDNYPNLFQTGKEPKTLRLELIQPKTMHVVIGYKDDPLQKVYPIATNVKMNSWNHVTLVYTADQKLRIKLNNNPTVSFVDNKFDPAVNDFVLGAGFDKQRTFVGSIKNTHFHIVFHETSAFLYTLGFLWKYYGILIIFQLVFIFARYYEEKHIKIKKVDDRSSTFGVILTTAIVFLAVLIAGVFSFPFVGNSKWIPFIILLIPFLLLGLNILKIEKFTNKYTLVVASLIAFGVVIAGTTAYIQSTWVSISGIIIICCCLSIIPLLRYFSIVSASIFIFLFSINSVIFVTNYGSQNYFWIALLTAITVWAFLFALAKQNQSFVWKNVNKIGFPILLFISAFLALRSDALFLGSSEYHWGYYTGIIQTIRSGGELLWSAPSQYGFLNLLLPALLPFSARNSLFIFQAILFIISTTIIIYTLFKNYKNSTVFILISLTALSLFYFADPALIGPTLYPSSSVLRFFWCYILLFAILLEYFRGNILTNNIKWFITLSYVFGIMWSAESLLYCTVIYGSYLFASAIVFTKSKRKNIFLFLFKNILVVFISFLIAMGIYVIITGHLPDWSMYFMYALGYAGGFGEQPIPLRGIHWAVTITLAGIVFIVSRFYSGKQYSRWIVSAVCLSTLWVLLSYYVGRAVVNNITALLPIIFYIFVVLLSVVMDERFLTYRLLLTAIFLPWIVVGVMGGVGNPQFIETASHFRFAENIDSKSLKPDAEITNIFDDLGAAKGTRIVYYGDPFTNPVIQNKEGNYIDITNGMPMPLTLLETPISGQERKIIIGRFMSDNIRPVYLIHKKNEPNTRFSDWYSFFKVNYSIKKIQSTVTYEVFIIKKKK